MKLLHRKDLYGWSAYDESRDLDFNSVLWVREGGNVVIDPLPLTPHDAKHLVALGGAAHIVVTNSDHVRDAQVLAKLTGASVGGPAAERDGFPCACERWYVDGDEVVPGLSVITLNGSKTPGELALILGETLITGDLVRCHQAGRLCLLPPPKLKDAVAARESVARLAALPGIEAVLTGDGWPVFTHGAAALGALAESPA